MQPDWSITVPKNSRISLETSIKYTWCTGKTFDQLQWEFTCAVKPLFYGQLVNKISYPNSGEDYNGWQWDRPEIIDANKAEQNSTEPIPQIHCIFLGVGNGQFDYTINSQQNKGYTVRSSFPMVKKNNLATVLAKRWEILAGGKKICIIV